MRKASAILTSDWHLMEKVPACRTDNFLKAQDDKVYSIDQLQREHNCPILNAGDLFDKGNPSHELIEWLLRTLPNEMYVVPGQHDLWHHRMDSLNKSGLGVVGTAGRVKVVSDRFVLVKSQKEVFTAVIGFGWGKTLLPLAESVSRKEMVRLEEGFEGSVRKVALCHTLAYENKPWPDAPLSGNAKAIMDKLEGFDLIVTGDNHKPFIVKKGEQLLVNPGSLMRLSADQIDHKPRIYLWFADTNEVEPVYLPIQRGAVSREHIEIAEKRDKRMEAFVKRLDGDFSVELSFEENLKKHFQANRTSQSVKDLVWEAIE